MLVTCHFCSRLCSESQKGTTCSSVCTNGTTCSSVCTNGTTCSSVCTFQLEIGIPTISLVYLQDNQKYVH